MLIHCSKAVKRLIGRVIRIKINGFDGYGRVLEVVGDVAHVDLFQTN
jgi:hypothetical protein